MLNLLLGDSLKHVDHLLLGEPAGVGQREARQHLQLLNLVIQDLRLFAAANKGEFFFSGPAPSKRFGGHTKNFDRAFQRGSLKSLVPTEP